jgi:hypothetical protein
VQSGNESDPFLFHSPIALSLEIYRLMTPSPDEIFEVYDKNYILARLLLYTGLEAHVR